MSYPKQFLHVCSCHILMFLILYILDHLHILFKFGNRTRISSHILKIIIVEIMRPKIFSFSTSVLCTRNYFSLSYTRNCCEFNSSKSYAMDVISHIRIPYPYVHSIINLNLLFCHIE